MIALVICETGVSRLIGMHYLGARTDPHGFTRFSQPTRIEDRNFCDRSRPTSTQILHKEIPEIGSTRTMFFLLLTSRISLISL